MAEQPPASLPRPQALLCAARFQELFAADTYTRWVHAGGIRRKDPMVGELVHLVEPMHDTAPMADARLQLMGLNRPRSRLWIQLDQLMAAGTIHKAYHPRLGFIWEEHCRVVIFKGRTHVVLAMPGRSWGLGLVAATGPEEFVLELFAQLKARGYDVRPGLQLVKSADGGRVDARTEERLLKLAGIGGVSTLERGKQGRTVPEPMAGPVAPASS